MLIEIRNEINVQSSLANTFHFFCNPANDHIWRKEINQTDVKGKLQQGVQVFEYSKLSSKHPNNLIVLQCVAYDENKLAIFESLENARFYLKSTRTVQQITSSETRIIYELVFDSSIVKFALGFGLPRFLITMKARSDMKKYLLALKRNVESRLFITQYLETEVNAGV